MSDKTNISERIEHAGLPRAAGFTILEVLAALLILALASSSVLLVMDRCLASASDSVLRMEAFELVRENLEKVLVCEKIEETVDFGTSERYPSISWQTVVEGFSEPVSGAMWMRAVCSADYLDSRGEKQKIELEHWLAQLTDQQAGQLLDQQDLGKLEMEQTMKTDEEAAAYAKIDTDTLRQWVQDGLVRTQEEAFLRYNLDIFIQNKGSPTPEQKAEQVESIRELALKRKMEQKAMEQDAALGILPDAGAKGAGKAPPTDPLPKKDTSQLKNLMDRKQR
jgi:prepilin-type N-terminal cleavage/methylation domain-containing protein